MSVITPRQRRDWPSSGLLRRVEASPSVAGDLYHAVPVAALRQPSASDHADISSGHFQAPPLLFGTVAVMAVLAGLVAVVMVQTMPLLGWVMWVAALTLVGTLGILWYRRESRDASQLQEDIRLAARQRVEEKSRAELRRLRGLRRAELMDKYRQDHQLVERIIMGGYWHGQTAGQLIDALGNPADIDARIRKGQRREVWKYHQADGNRYRLQIALENEAVVDWEQRG